MPVTIGNLRATWANSNIAYTGIGLNVNATSYDANSSLLDLKLNSNTILKLASNGDFIIKGANSEITYTGIGLNVNATWANSNIAYTGIGFNVNAASSYNANSVLLDIKLNSNTILKLASNGDFIIKGNVGIGSGILTPPTDGLKVVTSNKQQYARISSWAANTMLNVGFADIIALANNGTHYSQLGHISGGKGFLYFYANSDSEILTTTSKALSLGTDSNTVLTISNTGSVGIGNTAPVYKLQVDGKTLIKANTFISEAPVTAGLYVNYTGAGIMYGQAFIPAQNTTTSIIFYNAGRGSIGSISQTTSGVTYNTTSDHRLKENVVSITDGSTRLAQLKPRRFNFIGESYTMDGFLAHEVQDIVPEAVTGKKDDVDEQGNIKPQFMDAAKLVPLLTATIQDLMKKIEILENEIIEIKKAINVS